MNPRIFNHPNACKDCPDRYVGCHSKCQKWNNYVTERDELYEKKLNARLEKEDVNKIKFINKRRK